MLMLGVAQLILFVQFLALPIAKIIMAYKAQAAEEWEFESLVPEEGPVSLVS